MLGTLPASYVLQIRVNSSDYGRKDLHHGPVLLGLAMCVLRKVLQCTRWGMQ